ncbi:MAG: DNA repair protein RadC [Rhodospirillales bacterium]|nr:MAG: DNA repair protein RadC [Rhodospirillales bacterium]
MSNGSRHSESFDTPPTASVTRSGAASAAPASDAGTTHAGIVLASPPPAAELSDSAVLAPLTAAASTSHPAPPLRWHELLDGTEDALSDQRLLALLLQVFLPPGGASALTGRLLDRFGSLAGVIAAEPCQLRDFPAVPEAAIGFLKAMRAVAVRMARAEVVERRVLDNWDRVIAYLRTTMAHRRVEQLRVLFLDRANAMIADEVLHEGTIDHTPVYPREIVKRALTLDASALIMVHNHPSNQYRPSPSDVAMTETVRQALELVGIVLHDHLIIARRGHSSFRRLGLL